MGITGRRGGGKLSLFVRAAIILLLLFSVSLNAWFIKSGQTSEPTVQSEQFPLLAKRIFVEDPNDTILNFAPLRQELRKFFSNQNLNFSFYAEYLPTGTSIKVNQDNQMVGASLLKVPVVMNLFRAIERGEVNLTDVVTIKEGDVDKRSGTLWQKGVGARVTLKEVARYAIVDSDNTAVNVLIGVASGKFDLFQEAIDELDINLSVENDTQSTLGAQGYGSLLKCLYLSCFTNYAHSQLLLQWMAESNSPPRLKFEIPPTTQVAHKYGTSGGRSESDCGIVYIPKRPYIICVMVDAPPEQANAFIAEVSGKVYDYIVSVGQ
jgi:beta-lactamase class A